MNEFRVACELVRNGAIGKVEKVECSFGDPGRPCDLTEEALEPGLDWDFLVRPGAAARFTAPVLSPRGIHKGFPGVAQLHRNTAAAASATGERITSTSLNGVWAWTTAAP